MSEITVNVPTATAGTVVAAPTAASLFPNPPQTPTDPAVVAAFRATAGDVARAIERASIVRPRDLAGPRSNAYLIVARREGAHICSRGPKAVAYAPLGGPLVVDVEGGFALPARHVGFFANLPADDTVAVTALWRGEDPRYVCAPRCGGGIDHATYDPRLFTSCEPDVHAAGPVAALPARVLREALAAVAPFVPRDDDDVAPASRAVVLRPGRVVAMSPTGAAIFKSRDISGKLDIPAAHLAMVREFAARSEGTISLRTTPSMSFAVSENGDAVGWGLSRVRLSKFLEHPLSRDDLVFRAETADLRRKLCCVRRLARGGTNLRLVLGRERAVIGATFEGGSLEMAVRARRESHGKARGTSIGMTITPEALVALVDDIRSPVTHLRLATTGPTAVLRVRERRAIRDRDGIVESHATITRYALGNVFGA